jgi:hypothetical protein
MSMPSPRGVCGRRRGKGVKLDADDTGRLRDLDDIPDGVGGVCRTSKSNGEAENRDEAIADTLSKPAKYEKDSEFGSFMVLEV